MSLLDDLKKKYGQKGINKIIKVVTESSAAVEGIKIKVSGKGIVQDAKGYYEN